jgi:gamma-glutamylcyclotransferase (GGCT)/AIG2-like uncharacterized protein YtfP
MTVELFVYGTLLPGERNGHLLARAHPLGPRSTLPVFALLDMGTYPALVVGGDTAVVGELFRVDAELLTRLDALEEHPDLYVRQPIVLASGEPAQTYVLPRERAHGGRALPDGDWRRHASARRLARQPCYEDLHATWTWRPIPGCPGRSVLSKEDNPTLALVELVGPDARVSRYRVAAARDEVVVTWLVDGGLISYVRPDGSWLHTLNTPDGLARKLAQLGIEPKLGA